jgi:hypothetical protein
MKKLLSVALLGALWLSVSAFEWTNAGGDPYTGTRQAAIARSGFPAEVQATFLKMIEEDKANEAANRTEGINYTTDVIPKDYTFDWTMFGRDKRETGVFARTSHWNQSVDRRARVYRVHVRNGVEGGTEYILFFPLVCLNPSGKTRGIPYCVCPPETKVCAAGAEDRTRRRPGSRRRFGVTGADRIAP